MKSTRGVTKRGRYPFDLDYRISIVQLGGWSEVFYAN
jgi:hypothetical protein